MAIWIPCPKALLLFLVPMILPSCSRHIAPSQPEPTIAPCPSFPNCVSSNSSDKRHAIAPLALHSGDAPVWPRVRAAVASLPRTRIVEERDNYLHAECRTLLGFVDDLELQLRPNEKAVAVRSAARIGYYDFGVNRRRVERLRRLLQKN